MILAPRRPTFRRLRRHIFTRFSIIRELEHELLETLTIKGRILDLGGGKTALYNQLLKIEGDLESINISEQYQPTYIADANQPWPIDSNSYDTFISFNTYEHLCRDVHAIHEAVRVLKPGGVFHIIVPFMFRMHASPSDYHRHTAFGWETILTEAGIPPSHHTIEPMTWDSMGTAFSFLELTRLRLFKPLAMMIGPLRCLGLKGDRLPDDLAVHWCEYALGYYLTGTKPA